MRLNELAKRMRTAGDERRLSILCALFASPTSCVSEVADAVHSSVATTSHHLRALEREGLLESVRDGKRICYRLSRAPFVVDLKRFICRHRS